MTSPLPSLGFAGGGQENANLVFLQVCCALHEFAGQNNAEEGDFVEMENDMRNFALAWLEPLKEELQLRDTFSGPLYSLVVDKAIETGQKKARITYNPGQMCRTLCLSCRIPAKFAPSPYP